MKNKFFSIKDLPNEKETQILIGGRFSGKSYAGDIIFLKWLKSVLIVYDDRGKFLLGIKPQYNEQECLDVIRGWLNEK